MAIGTAGDMKLYNPFIHAGMVETLTQASDGFNAASRGAIRLVAQSKVGEYDYESFFQNVSGLITRRDPTDVTDLTDKALTQEEFVRVKVNRTIGPVTNTIDSLRKVGRGDISQSGLDFALGRMAGKAAQIEMLNSALRCYVAAHLNQTAVTVDKHESGGTMQTSYLVDGLAKFGDAASSILIWVMHSKVYYDLVKEQISANIDGVSNFNVANATPITLNRPVLVTDSEALIGDDDSSPTATNYLTLGLTANAILAENTEEEAIVRDWVTGKANIALRYQGEYAYNLGVRGFKWDVTNGGANPTDTALATGSNWDSVMGSHKDYGGVVVRTL